MFDMRYHIASLVAVFLALAIGILLGTVIVDKGVLVDQQRALVKKIEANFDELRTENRALKDELGEHKKFETQIVPLTVQDRLNAANVGVIVTGSAAGEPVTNLVNDIRKAGSTAFSISLVENYKVTDEVIAQMKPYFTTDLTIENAQDLLIKKMIDELTINAAAAALPATTTTTVKTAPNVAYLQQLKNIGFIKSELSFAAPVKPITLAVILGGSNTARDPLKVDLPIILQLKALKIRTVGAETTDCEKSYMQQYQTAGIPTVDNADQPMGTVSVIFTLAGVDGNFGVKKTAQQLTPSS